MTIDVCPVNDAPTSADDAFSLDEGTTLTVDAAAGVLANDSDIDGDTLSASVVSGPANGTLTLNADGSFSYTPNASFSGTDSFIYQASDGSLQTPSDRDAHGQSGGRMRRWPRSTTTARAKMCR